MPPSQPPSQAASKSTSQRFTHKGSSRGSWDGGVPWMTLRDSVADVRGDRTHLGMEFRGFKDSFEEYAEAL